MDLLRRQSVRRRIRKGTALVSPRAGRHLRDICLILLAAGGAVFAQEAAPEDPFTAGLLRPFESLKGSSSEADWESEAILSRQAVERLWKRNGWDSEADRFARDLAGEIAAIPPWDPLGRLNTFSRRISMRYGLTGDKSKAFNRVLMREVGKLMIKNAPLLIRQGGEMLGTRSEGRPFSPEQVAAWSRELDPFMDEFRSTVDAMSSELEPLLSEEGKKTFHDDLESFQKRNRYLNQMAERWTRGEWKAEDWGLDGDPIQGGQGLPQRVASSAETGLATGKGAAVQRPGVTPTHPPPKAAAIPRCLSHDHMSWIGCVVEVAVRFKLDGGQMSAAESIHQELFDRAENFCTANRDSLSTVPEASRGTHAAYAAIRELHGELMERLNAIPTRFQREAVKP